jgi:hypothetical protein
MKRLLPLLGLLLTSACASITQGTTQSVSVVTEPPGANCIISREGAQVAVVNPTPGTIRIDKSSRALDLRCTLDNHEPGLTSVASSVQAMTAGNILVGGAIGLAVDAATGAMHQYPQNVSMSLRRTVSEIPPSTRR